MPTPWPHPDPYIRKVLTRAARCASAEDGLGDGTPAVGAAEGAAPVGPAVGEAVAAAALDASAEPGVVATSAANKKGRTNRIRIGRDRRVSCTLAPSTLAVHRFRPVWDATALRRRFVRPTPWPRRVGRRSRPGPPQRAPIPPPPRRRRSTRRGPGAIGSRAHRARPPRRSGAPSPRAGRP